MFNNEKQPFGHNDAWRSVEYLAFRINGKSYTKNQVYSYCHSKYVKKGNYYLKRTEINIEEKVILVYASNRDTYCDEILTIPFSEISKITNDKEPVYLTYKDREYTRIDLDLIAYDYIKRTYHGLFTSYRVSHKTSELVIKYRDGGFFEKSVKIPLDGMEKDLLRIINYKKY